MEINHVLIVEDDKEIREGVQIYLQSQGYKVFQASIVRILLMFLSANLFLNSAPI